MVGSGSQTEQQGSKELLVVALVPTPLETNPRHPSRMPRITNLRMSFRVSTIDMIHSFLRLEVEPMRTITGSLGVNRNRDHSGLDLGYQCLGSRSKARKKGESLAAAFGELRIIAGSVFVKFRALPTLDNLRNWLLMPSAECSISNGCQKPYRF